MIHYTPEHAHFKIGLNFCFAPRGFRVTWAWYDFATRNAVKYRFRLRIGKGNNFMWEVNRFNVIAAYLAAHDFELVNREVLQDLKDFENAHKRTSEALAVIKPLQAQ